MPRALIHEPEERMTREDYRAWAEQQPSHRFERIEGVVVAMAPERAAHNLRKKSACNALDAAVRRAGMPCQVFTDGMTIEVGDSDYEPDAVVRCGGDRLPANAHGARGGPVEPGHQGEGGGLAAPRRADDGAELPGLDGHGDVAQGSERIPAWRLESLGDPG